MSNSALSRVVTPEMIERVEGAALKLPQVECPLTHTFGPGIYMREVVIPAGSFVIGHHHNYEHTNIMLCGHATSINDDGSTTDFVAPMMYIGKPGRKVLYVHSDTVWLNVFATDETDVEALEARLLTKSDTWLANAAVEKTVNLLMLESDRTDYYKAISEFGLSHEDAHAIATDESDMIPLPFGSYKMSVSNSCIHGRGIFATSPISPGEIIAPARIDGKRTIAGRYTNHSAHPNARMVLCENGDVVLVATTDITGAHGGQVGQEITINYREALGLSLGGDVCLR